MLKNSMFILTEAMELNMADSDVSVDNEQLSREVEELDELEESTNYVAEMIPVFNTSQGYLVEFDMIEKLVESELSQNRYCDLDKAISMVQEVNMLGNEIGILIESEESVKNNLANLKDQLKKTKNPKNKNVIKKRIDDTVALLKKMKDRGKVVKKKSTKKNTDEE